MAQCSATNALSTCCNTSPPSSTTPKPQRKRTAVDKTATPPEKRQRILASAYARSSTSPQAVDCQPIQNIYASYIKKGLSEVVHRLGCKFERRSIWTAGASHKLALDPEVKDAVIGAVRILQHGSFEIKKEGLKKLLHYYGAQAKK